MKITFSGPSQPRSGTLVVSVLEGRKMLSTAAALDRKSSGAVSRAMKASRFKGEKGQLLSLLAPSNLPLKRLVLLGIGKAKDIDDKRAQDAGGHIVAGLATSGESTVQIAVDAVKGTSLGAGDIATHLAFGARLRSYRFDKYRTKEKPKDKPSLKTLIILVKGHESVRKAFMPMEKTAAGVFLSRDLVSEPSNVLYPEALAKQAKVLEKLGVRVGVLNRAKLRKLGMGALLGVAQGSAHSPCVVMMQWKGAPKAKNKRPVAFIGKGVTFDTGGISIKPSGGMEDMKWDMAGAGVVIGLMKTLAGRKAKVNAVGVVGLVENMPSGSAQRPGDIVTSMSGQTIEVLNTDAEGRLVLADALYYCQKRFKPRLMVDLATLTGAIIVALGNEIAGLFSNDDDLAVHLTKSGNAVGEQIWRFPLNDSFDKLLNCDIADMKNITGIRGAGSITAAQFLQRFVNKVPWAHLDIAGVTWSSKDKPTVPKGGTGFGVRLLDRFVADYCEGD